MAPLTPDRRLFGDLQSRQFGPVASWYLFAPLGRMNTVCPGQVSFIHV